MELRNKKLIRNANNVCLKAFMARNFGQRIVITLECKALPAGIGT
jgi:hypothetical protein